MDSETQRQIRDFITANYLFGDESRTPADDQDLLLTGIIDSTGILELIEFLEAEFDIHVGEAETVPDNLGSIANLTRYVRGKSTG